MDPDGADADADPIVISKGENEEDCEDGNKENAILQSSDLARGEAVVHTGG